MIVSQWNRLMEHEASGQKSEMEYFDILKSRILKCTCSRIISNEPTSFHDVDMIKECARGVLDQLGVDEYQFSGEHPFYQRVHDEIYRPLVEADLMVETRTTPSQYHMIQDFVIFVENN